MELAIKTAVMGIVSAIFAILLRKNSPELALLLCVITAMSICTAGIFSLQEIISLWESFSLSSDLSQTVMAPVAKCVALGMTTKLSSDLCRDAGSSSIASAVELIGSIAALIVASPLMIMLLEMLRGLM